MSEPVRLNKLLAERFGIARRKADAAISEGRVTVDGRRAEIGERVDPSGQKIVFDGKILPDLTKRFSFAFHKPRGYVTTLQTSREYGKPISELLPPELGLKPAGRLDTESEGLLIVSNDGSLINAITHPRFELEKEYRVFTEQEVYQSEVDQLEYGIELDDGWCEPDRIQQTGKRELIIVIHEGRKREIRRLINAVGHHVYRLIRIRIGEVELADLQPGALRILTEQEEQSLRH